MCKMADFLVKYRVKPRLNVSLSHALGRGLLFLSGNQSVVICWPESYWPGIGFSVYGLSWI